MSTLPYPSGSEIMRGIVVHKGWTKTAESWDAGGSDYYVLSVADKEPVILRPSDRITFADFEQYVGKQIEVVGQIVEPHPWRPSNDFEQRPEGATRRGGGFRVEKIIELAE